MKFLNFNRVLVLAPHPDDAEYSMSGVVLKYTDTHFDILCLTQGGDCDSTTDKIDYMKLRMLGM
jgi:LmbE family N-acetylglucosaminyl deacetylase